MCFREWVGLVGSCFLREREVFLSENGQFQTELQNFKFSAQKRISDESKKILPVRFALVCSQAMVLHQTFHQSTSRLCHAKSRFCSNFSTQLTSISLFNRTKITYTFPFHRLPAASSPHCNFDFPQNPILRQHCNRPFPPVQNMAVRIVALIKFSKKS